MKQERSLTFSLIGFCIFIVSVCFSIIQDNWEILRGSFIEGTEVWTKQGPVPIENITRGTEIYAYDIESEQWSYKPVIETIAYDYAGDLVTITAGKATITATADHPFYVVKDSGSDYRPHIRLSNSKGWVPARHLRSGDILLLKDNSRLTVENVRSNHTEQKVYNLNVSGDHTYTVHERGVLVSDVVITVKEVVHSYGGGCFPAGTKIWTNIGFMSIDDIQEGIKVFSQDTRTGQWAYKKVLKTPVHEYDGDIVVINTGNTEVEATGNHPFWVVRGNGLDKRPPAIDIPYMERGMTSRGRWVEARHLIPGDVLSGLDNKEISVKNLYFIYTPITVCNLCG